MSTNDGILKEFPDPARETIGQAWEHSSQS